MNLKATPIIHSNTDVSLKIELNIRTLGNQSVNGIPIILNREYTGSITLKNEESGVVAGLHLQGGLAQFVRLPIPQPGSRRDLWYRRARQECERRRAAGRDDTPHRAHGVQRGVCRSVARGTLILDKDAKSRSHKVPAENYPIRAGYFAALFTL